MKERFEDISAEELAQIKTDFGESASFDDVANNIKNYNNIGAFKPEHIKLRSEVARALNFSYFIQGRAEYAAENKNEAIYLLNKGLASMQPKHKFFAMAYLGEIYSHKKEQYKKSRSYFLQALNLMKEYNLSENDQYVSNCVIQIYGLIGQGYLDNKENLKAIKSFKQALSYSTIHTKHILDLQKKINHALGGLYLNQNDFVSSEKYYSSTIDKSLFVSNDDWYGKITVSSVLHKVRIMLQKQESFDLDEGIRSIITLVFEKNDKEIRDDVNKEENNLQWQISYGEGMEAIVTIVFSPAEGEYRVYIQKYSNQFVMLFEESFYVNNLQ